MALTDQPYLPLFVDDWMNNNKLKVCSPASHGVMIAIMCIMHKEPEYGKILLKQKFKQTGKQIKDFALQIAKQTSFDLFEIEPALDELINESVITIEGDYLVSFRMVKDADTSIKRAMAGKVGGINSKRKPADFASDFAKANNKANAETENETITLHKENELIESINIKEGKNEISLPDNKAKEAVRLYYQRNYVLITEDDVQRMFDAFKIQRVGSKKNYYQDESDVLDHFFNWLPSQKFELQNGVAPVKKMVL